MSNWSKKFFDRFDDLSTQESILLNQIAENFALPKGVCPITLLSANQLYVKQQYIMLLPLQPVAFDASITDPLQGGPGTSIKNWPGSGFVPFDAGIPIWASWTAFKFQPAYSYGGALTTDITTAMVSQTKVIGFRECYKGDLT